MLQLTGIHRWDYDPLPKFNKTNRRRIVFRKASRSPNVANFFLIDHSLRKPGGHHFDYARCVAQASNELGFLTTIGTHRSFQRSRPTSSERLEQFGSVRRIFRQTTYQPDSYLAGLQHLTRSKHVVDLLNESEPNRIQRYSNILKRFQHRRRREKFVRRFAHDCERFFRPLQQSVGDHAFLTTVSELELMGLAVYLSSQPKTLNTHWHLQFHYNLFDGRPPEYDSQRATAQAVRACFLTAMARMPYHSIHLYATSETLMDQYNRLGVGDFAMLPYPISPEFAADPVRYRTLLNASNLETAIQRPASVNTNFPDDPTAKHVSFSNLNNDRSKQVEQGFPGQVLIGDRESRKPLRITCPGEVRREKGHVAYLQSLVDEIWPSHLSTGNAQVVVQRPSRKWHAKKAKIDITFPKDFNSTELATAPIEYFSHPLSHQDYVELIKSTDIGLLFYDSRVYFSRRAGVLGELLSCGKPVIVPAGSWLADQIQEPSYRHVEGLLKSSRVLQTYDTAALNWNSRNVPMPGNVLSFDHDSHPFEFTIERVDDENHFVLQFDWHWPSSAGVYCRIDATQHDKSGRLIASSSQVRGFRQSAGKVNSVFRFDTNAELINFSLTNAFHDSTASLKSMEVHAIATIPINEDSGETPLGSVGVIASDREDLPNCIDEIVNHYDHYRETASAFSQPWYAQHDPRLTVDHLLSTSRAQDQSLNRAG